MKKGKIIAIEGIDGSGKDTQIEFLKEVLDEDKNVFLREPGSSDAGQAIRRVILDHSEISTETQIMLFNAARFETMKIIEEAINSGKNVILNRFEMSTQAYQIYGNQRHDLKEFADFLSSVVVPEDKKPDLYVLFDLPPEVAKQRVVKRDTQEMTWFDKKSEEYFNHISKGYKEELKKYNHLIINAQNDIDTVKEDFLPKIVDFLK